MPSVSNTAARVLGISVTATLFVLCFIVELWECYLSYVTLHLFTGSVLFVLFVFFCGSALLNACLVMARDPGQVPAWLSVERVNAFVAGELERLASGPRTSGSAAAAEEGEEDVAERPRAPLPVVGERRPDRIAFAEGADVDTADRARANDILSQSLQARAAYEDDPATDAGFDGTDDVIDFEADSAPTHAFGNTASASAAGGAYTPFPLDRPDRMEERRQRKRRHGLRMRTVADVAYEALCRLRSGGSEDPSRTNDLLVHTPGDDQPVTRDDQMQMLLLGAKRCRLCQCYKLQETHHCTRCARCVYRMDHHCFWLGCCIGTDNQKNFLLFLVYICAACVETSLLSLWVLYIGRNALFEEEYINLNFFLAFTVVMSFGLVLPPFTLQHFYDLGRGESTLRAMRREERQAMRQLARRVVESSMYEPVLEEDDGNAPLLFRWENLRVAFGVGRVIPDWLLPTPPERSSSAETEAAFWTEVRDMVEHQVYSIADSTGEGNAHASGVNPHRPSSRRQPVAAVLVDEASDDLMNVQIDLVEPDFHVSALSEHTKSVNQPSVAPGLRDDESAPRPQTGTIVGPPRASSDAPSASSATVGRAVSSKTATSPPPSGDDAVRGAEVSGPQLAADELPVKKIRHKAD